MRSGIGKRLFAWPSIVTMNDDDNPFHSDFGDDDCGDCDDCGDEKEDDADAKNAKVLRSTGSEARAVIRDKDHTEKVTITQSGAQSRVIPVITTLGRMLSPHVITHPAPVQI